MKGDNSQVNYMVIMAVAAVVGLVLFQAVAQYVGNSTTTVTVRNVTYAAPTAPGYTDIPGAQSLITSISVVNATSGTAIDASNVTLVERVGTDGLLTISLYNADSRWNGRNVNISMTYGPDGYVNDSGARSVTLLITLMAAVAIVIFSIPSLREGIFEYIKG